ncbi:MAG: amino acid deaminase [Microcella pacifica]|uniref:Amino acid deaminase n=1 Tax=Microcella pacifica TaxID=2591847 RepID=A0A9E5JM45_9MICO|nr:MULTISPECIES: amino acid deaminase [Microcella]NHF63130.1 amino acid deaminase [Microcella pacifica]
MIHTLDDAAARALTDPSGVLREHSWLGAAIDDDVGAGRLEKWGRSTAMDENTGTATVDPALFAALHSRAHVEARWPVGHAGLLHVYGYLLSTTPTPYGLKRERWLDGGLARAYGLADDAFVPWARSTTLLERVSDAAEALVALGATRVQTVDGVESVLALGRARDDGPFALAYAVDGRLVTTFPVGSAESVLAEWDADAARLRWNAAGEAHSAALGPEGQRWRATARSSR